MNTGFVTLNLARNFVKKKKYKKVRKFFNDESGIESDCEDECGDGCEDECESECE